jgi:hypothetical protein
VGLFGLLTLAAAVAACDSSTTPAPSSTVAPTGSPTAAASDAPGPTDGGTNQTDTAWGRIWDEIPASFPLPQGATPTETGEGPYSAEFALLGDTSATVGELVPRLDATDLTITEVQSPLEDGTIVIDLVGDGDCLAQVTIGPRGTLTLMRVLYGSRCPLD